jgi:allantoin racemase
MSVVGLIDDILDGPPADACVLACFGDPGSLAAREITNAPVFGIAKVAMHAATFISTSFSVVTTLERTRIITEHRVRTCGMERHCRRVRATDVPVLS